MAAYLPETEAHNFYRLTTLLVDNGTAVLRKLLMKYVMSQSSSLDEHLAKYQTELARLENRHILNESQMDFLCPAGGAAANIDTFDITLVCCLINNVCGKLPKHEKEEIQKLRNVRNEVLGHLPNASIDGNTFKCLWDDLNQIIITLAQFCADPAFVQQVKDDIEELWTTPKLKPSCHVSDLLRQWTLSEQNLREEIKKKHGEIETKQRSLDMRTSALEQKQKTKTKGLQKYIDPERLRSSLMSTYEECYSCISISPIFEKREVPLDKLFTDVVIVEEENVTKDKGASWNTMGQGESHNTNEIPVQSYEDIFYKKGTTDVVKSIFVLGPAGVGKTVFTQQMVDKWVQAHRKLKQLQTGQEGFFNRVLNMVSKVYRAVKADKANKEQRTENPSINNKDEETMAKFDFLFYVPLRYVKKSDTLLDAVYQTVGDDQVNRVTTEYVFETCPEKILVICDGLDEIDWFPSRHNFHSYTIVTTTRPWKYDVVRGISPRADRLLQLRGLCDDGVSRLAERFRRACYPDRPASSVKNFKKETKKLGLTDTLKGSPLILVYFLHIWYQTNKLTTSLTANLFEIVECILQRGENKFLSQESNPLLGQDLALSREKIKGEGLLGRACYKYGKLLMAAAEIAFKSLTDSVEEHTLVFSEASLHSTMNINPTHLDLCLRLGFFSKSEKTHILHKEQTISFHHKLFQELFMAIHLASDQSALAEFCNYCDSLVEVLEFSNVFMFTTALCKETALQLSNHVVDICDSDSNILDFWSQKFNDAPIAEGGIITWYNQFGPTINLMGNLTQMYARCIEEHDKVKPGETCELHTNGIYISTRTERRETNEAVLTRLIQTNKNRLKTFYVNTVLKMFDVKSSILHSLTKINSLTHLHIEPDYFDTTTVSYLEKILANNSQLCVLYIDLASPWYRPNLFDLKLPTLQNLQHLHIGHVRITEKTIHQLSTLLVERLRTLQLVDLNISGYDLNMSHMINVHHLTVYDRMSDSEWWKILQEMNTLPAIEKLVLGDTSSRKDSFEISSPSDAPKLTFLTKLHTLKLHGFTDNSQVLQHVLGSIGDGSQIRGLHIRLACSRVGPMSSLLFTITQLRHLEELALCSIDTDEHHLNLTNNKNLKVLELEFVKMPPEAWSHLFVCIQSLYHLNELRIQTSQERDPDLTSWSLLFTSLRSLRQLTLLNLEYVNIPADAINIPSHLTVTYKKQRDDGNIKHLHCEQQ